MSKTGGRSLIRALLFVGLTAGVASPAAAHGQSTSHPKLLVITTGGTIAGGPAGAAYTGEDFLEGVPQIREIAEVTVEELIRVGSSKITPDHWLRLAHRINAAFREDPELAGVVVTHGTDSMEETAYFLTLTVRDPRPVVLVGAMRNWSQLSADGPANLFNAARVATAPEAVGKGVLVVMNDEISSARDVQKTDALRVQTFRSLDRGFLGVADSDAVVFHRAPLLRHTTGSEFDVSELEALPEVPIVTDYTGSDGSMILEWAARGAEGIVVAGFPTGLLSTGSTEAALEVAARQVPIVVASRAPFGRVSDAYRLGDAGSPRPIAARDLPAHKARILLMLALTRTRDPAEIQEMFERY